MSRKTAGRPQHSSDPRRTAHTLLVRLWRESGTGNGTAIWRGQLADLEGRALGAFASEQELLLLLRAATGATLPATSRGDPD